MDKEPKFTKLDAIIAPIAIPAAIFLVWSLTDMNQFIDLSLKLNAKWNDLLRFLLQPTK